MEWASIIPVWRRKLSARAHELVLGKVEAVYTQSSGNHRGAFLLALCRNEPDTDIDNEPDIGGQKN